MVTATKLQPRRDRYGRYMIPDPVTAKDRAWTRATTISKTISDEYHLKLYGQRMVAKGIGLRRDLYALAAATPLEDKDTLNSLCRQASDAAAASGKANLGTALHAFSERVDRGESLASVNAPAPWDQDVAAYVAKIASSGVTIEANMIERIVTLHGPGIAGTFDRIVRVPGRSLPMIADLKTGSFLGWQEFAIQFALYANADSLYNLGSGLHEPMPVVDKDTALVIHLPVGTATCDLYFLDIAAGWEAAQHAFWVRGWHKRKNLSTPVPAPTPQGTLPFAGP